MAAETDSPIPAKSAAGFEVLYRFKMLQRAKSVLIVAASEDEARKLFNSMFEDEEKKPSIVGIAATVVSL